MQISNKMIMDAKKKSIFIILLLYLLPLTISLTYGFQYRFVDFGLETYFKILSLPWFVVLIGLSWCAVQVANKDSATPPEWLGLTLSTLSLALTSFFYLAKVTSSPVWIACAVIPAVLAAWLAQRNPKLGIRIVALCGLVLNIYLITIIPHTSGANMLEIIEAASVDFLAGNDPYHTYEGIAETSFGYLPGLWLPYVPLVWLDLDPRILNILLLLLVAWIFERHLGLHSGRRANILGVTLYPLLLSPLVSQMIVHGHVWPYWVFLLITVVFLGYSRYLLAAIFFGLTLATRQPALWLIFPITGYLAMQVGWLKTARYAALSLGIYLSIVLPFALPVGEEFWKVVYLGVSDFSTSQPHLTAATWFAPLGLTGLLRPIQILVLLFSLYWLYKQKAGFSTFLAIAGSAYLMAVFFNSYAVRYVYIPGLLLIAASIILRFAPLRSAHSLDD